MRFLRHEINNDDREYYIEKVNKPLVKAITILGNRYPEPTEETILHHNSKLLLKRLELYLEYEENSRVAQIVKAVIRIAISKIEHSPNWRDRISWWVEGLGDWKPRSYGHPLNQWNEPKPYGGR